MQNKDTQMPDTWYKFFITVNNAVLFIKFSIKKFRSSKFAVYVRQLTEAYFFNIFTWAVLYSTAHYLESFLDISTTLTLSSIFFAIYAVFYNTTLAEYNARNAIISELTNSAMIQLKEYKNSYLAREATSMQIIKKPSFIQTWDVFTYQANNQTYSKKELFFKYNNQTDKLHINISSNGNVVFDKRINIQTHISSDLWTYIYNHLDIRTETIQSIKYFISSMKSGGFVNTKDAEKIRDLARKNIGNVEDFKTMLSRFSGYNLSKTDLSMLFLHGINLIDAQLSGVDLVYAQLQCSNFDRAELYGANLDTAQMQCSNFQFSKLVSANLNHANFTRANLYHAKLKGANITMTNFESANLEGAKFQNAYIMHDDYKKDDKIFITLKDCVENYDLNQVLRFPSFTNSKNIDLAVFDDNEEVDTKIKLAIKSKFSLY